MRTRVTYIPRRPHFLLALGVLFLCLSNLVAADQPTPINVAAAAVESNMATAAGKAYDEQLSRHVMQDYLPALKACKQKAEGDFRSFDLLVRVSKDGRASEVLLHPDTKMSQCLRETVLKDQFSVPPKPDYWVDIHIELRH